MVTQSLFTLLCVLVAAQRLCELCASRHNEAGLLARGGREHAPRHFAAMRLLHAAWLVSTCAEVWLLNRPFSAALALPMLGLFVLGQSLRQSARRALGPRWSVRIITLPGTPVVTSGPYRYLRHPNYLGVALEIAALPLIHGAWLSALVFSVANALLLAVRIHHEEAALTSDGDYAERFGGRSRFVPRREAT
jgi:methyltransferase